MDLWVASLVASGCPASMVRRYRRHVLAVLVDVDVELSRRVTTEQLQAVISASTWSVEERRKVRSSLIAWCGWLVDQGAARVNAAAALPVPGSPKRLERIDGPAELVEWWSWMRAAGRRPDTIDLRIRNVRVVLAGVPAPARTVTTEQLLGFLAAKEWAPNTRRSYRASLTVFFGWMQATGRRQDNPAALMPTIKVPRALPSPTPEDVYRDALLEVDERLRTMIQLAAVCGLRRGEISRLRRDDLLQDLVGWSLSIVGKGGHERMVPLPAGLAVELRAMPPGWLFPSAHRPGPLTPAHVGRLVSQAFPPGWTCHKLRHRCATIAYWSNRDLRAVQELLGHARPETTAVYTLVQPASIRAAVNATAA